MSKLEKLARKARFPQCLTELLQNAEGLLLQDEISSETCV